MILKIKNELAQVLSPLVSLPVEQIASQLEVPKTYDHGHLSFPVFNLAKQLKKNPAEVSAQLVVQLEGKVPFLEKVTALTGFLNFTFKSQFLAKYLFEAVCQDQKIKIGHQAPSGKNIVIDFSSPNVAKPMHIGHFRATILGEAVRRLALTQGHEVIGVNHIGDWGTQFGKLAWAIEKWGAEYDLQGEPIDSLLKLYIRFHDEAEKNPELEKKGAEYFLRLEQGDAEVVAKWKRIVEVSFVEYNKVYSLLNVRHDAVLGESFYNDKMEAVVRELEDKKLLVESDGARVVFFPEAEKIPPCIIKKSDGASIYATRDLAAAIYRREQQKGDLLLYVVGADQSLHFKQVFRVLELMGKEWAKNCHHIAFGVYRFKEGKMSTRKGKIVLAEDVIYQAIDEVKKRMMDRSLAHADKDAVAQQVAIGAIIFNDLVNDRIKNVDFDWDRVLNTEGDSGPFVQYTNVRCLSILRKYGMSVDYNGLQEFKHLDEQKLIFSLLQYEHVLAVAFRQYKPNILAQYLLELCSHFSHFYNSCRILGESVETQKSRIALVSATSAILTQGLGVLNIQAPQEM